MLWELACPLWGRDRRTAYGPQKTHLNAGIGNSSEHKAKERRRADVRLKAQLVHDLLVEQRLTILKMKRYWC